MYIVPFPFDKDTKFISLTQEKSKQPCPLQIPVCLPIPKDFEPTVLQQRTPHPRESRIQFDEESHTYFVDWDHNNKYSSVGIKSVSQFVKEWFEPFNADKTIKNMTRNPHRFSQSKYGGWEPQEIKELWEKNGAAASKAGTAFHFLAECYVNGWRGLTKEGSVYRTDTGIQQLMELFTKVQTEGWTFFRTELRMFTDVSLKMSGTADLLLVRADQPPPDECGGVLELRIVDFKNSRNIKMSNRYQKGKKVLKHLDDCNYVHYALQQNFYMVMMELWYHGWTYNGHHYSNIKIVDCELWVCHETYGRHAKVVKIPDMRSTIRALFEERRKQCLQ